jgi:hypothetical protein
MENYNRYAHVNMDKTPPVVDYMGGLPLVGNHELVEGMSKEQLADDKFLIAQNWFPLITIDNSVGHNKIKVRDEVIVNLDENTVTLTTHGRDMIDEEKLERDKSLLNSLRWERDGYLKLTDHYALTDVTMPEDVRIYRQALRDFPDTIDVTKWPDIVWPTPPKDMVTQESRRF